MNTILHPTIISNLQHLPLPADEVGAIADLKKWGATSGDVRAHQIAESGEGRLILTCLFGNSPYLANYVTHESSFLIDCLFDGVDTVFNWLLDALPKLVLGNTHTIRALESIAVAGSLPFRSVAEHTVVAQVFLNLQSITRISLSGQFEEKKELNGRRDVLVRASGAIDFSDLKGRLINSQRVVPRYFAVVVCETATVYAIDHSNRKESK